MNNITGHIKIHNKDTHRASIQTGNGCSVIDKTPTAWDEDDIIKGHNRDTGYQLYFNTTKNEIARVMVRVHNVSTLSVKIYTNCDNPLQLLKDL